MSDLFITVKTAAGDVRLEPAFCEVTGEQIGWQTVVPEHYITPALISFDAVNEHGEVKDENTIAVLLPFGEKS